MILTAPAVISTGFNKNENFVHPCNTISFLSTGAGPYKQRVFKLAKGVFTSFTMVKEYQHIK